MGELSHQAGLWKRSVPLFAQRPPFWSLDSAARPTTGFPASTLKLTPCVMYEPEYVAIASHQRLLGPLSGQGTLSRQYQVFWPPCARESFASGTVFVLIWRSPTELATNKKAGSRSRGYQTLIFLGMESLSPAVTGNLIPEVHQPQAPTF